MNKEYQFYILKELSEIYPDKSSDEIFNRFVEKSEGTNQEEKLKKTIKNLMVLNETGYLNNFFPRTSIDGIHSFNTDISISAKGLQLLDNEILSSADKESLIKTLLLQSQNTHKISDDKFKKLKDFLTYLPTEVLKKLVDKGLDKLLSLLFDIL